MLTGDTELRDPESSEDVIPAHPVHEGVRLELDVRGDAVSLRVAGREDPERPVQPEDGRHAQSDEGEQRHEDEVRHGVDRLPCLVEQGDHQGDPLPQYEKDQQHDGRQYGGSDGSGQEVVHLVLVLSSGETIENILRDLPGRGPVDDIGGSADNSLLLLLCNNPVRVFDINLN